MLGTREMRVIK